MRIERILYGMQTSDGRIISKYTDGVMRMLQPKSRDIIKGLKPEDSHRYLWFKTEQTLAYPVIIEVTDKDPSHGGRTWVQNQTFLVNIHDFINHYLTTASNPFTQHLLPEQEKFPDVFEPLNT
jgi:hypothetical protein